MYTIAPSYSKGVYKSEEMYGAGQNVKDEPVTPKLAERVKIAISSVVEYPGSSPNRWVLVEWVEAKFLAPKGGGHERG